jgi:hypothetical protein
MSIILATWEAEIRRITAPGQPGKIVHETPSPHLQGNQSKIDGGLAEAVEHLLVKS